MSVCLVTYVPNQLIEWSVVHIVESYGQFYNSQAGSKMASMHAYYVNDIVS